MSRRRTEILIPEEATLGDLFAALRGLNRMSAQDVAEALGLSNRSYRRIESGERVPDWDEVTAFAELTGQEILFFESVRRRDGSVPEPAEAVAGE